MSDIVERHPGYPDCKFCRGIGSFNIASPDTGDVTGTASCGNCAERRRWEGVDRQPQNAWCVWTKTGQRPRIWHDSREKAETEAIRLARKHPGQTFIVFEKLVNIRAALATEAE